MRDKVCKYIITFVQNDSWYQLYRPNDFDDLTQDEIQELKQFKKIKLELTISTERDLILKQQRIVLPQCYHKSLVKLAHVGHQGIYKTKEALRSKVYFVNMEKAVEAAILRCIPCQAVGKEKAPAKLKTMPLPRQVLANCKYGLHRPIPNENDIFVAINQRSRYPELEFVKSTSATVLINALDRIFSSYFWTTRNRSYRQRISIHTTHIENLFSRTSGTSPSCDTDMATGQCRS